MRVAEITRIVKTKLNKKISEAVKKDFLIMCILKKII